MCAFYDGQIGPRPCHQIWDNGSAFSFFKRKPRQPSRTDRWSAALIKILDKKSEREKKLEAQVKRQKTQIGNLKAKITLLQQINAANNVTPLPEQPGQRRFLIR